MSQRSVTPLVHHCASQACPAAFAVDGEPERVILRGYVVPDAVGWSGADGARAVRAVKVPVDLLLKVVGCLGDLPAPRDPAGSRPPIAAGEPESGDVILRGAPADDVPVPVAGDECLVEFLAHDVVAVVRTFAAT